MRFAVFVLALLVARDAPARSPRPESVCAESWLHAAPRPERDAQWADALDPIEAENVVTRASGTFRLYGRDGAIDEEARRVLERIAAGEEDAEVHPLAVRLEQLVVKAAYHFGRLQSPYAVHPARLRVVSGWRANAGRHGTGEALDFKLDGVRAAVLAAYLRQLPRAGVGVYTNRRTQFVHLDVREVSYHWLDASPPGVKWREARLADPGAQRRDASWTPEEDLP